MIFKTCSLDISIIQKRNQSVSTFVTCIINIDVSVGKKHVACATVSINLIYLSTCILSIYTTEYSDYSTSR